MVATELMPSPTLKYIIDLSPFPTYDIDMWLEVQRGAGGVGSSGRISKATLVTALQAALFPIQHNTLEALLNDDHPQYLNNARGDARYTPVAHAGRTDNPHSVTAAQVGADATGTAAGLLVAHLGATDPHPQYETSAEVIAKIAALKAEADPFPVYETGVEAQSKVDAGITSHENKPNPHTQYAMEAGLNARVAALVNPLAETAVTTYITNQAGPVIASEVNTQIPILVQPAINNSIGALKLEVDPFPTYQTGPEVDAKIAAMPGGLADAPSDGKQYARKDAAWTEVVGGLSIQTATSAATVTPAATNDKVVVSALIVDTTIANPSGVAAEGQGFVLAIYSAAAQTLAWGTGYRGFDKALPTTTIAGKWMYIPVMRNHTNSLWDVLTPSTQI